MPEKDKEYEGVRKGIFAFARGIFRKKNRSEERAEALRKYEAGLKKKPKKNPMKKKRKKTDMSVAGSKKTVRSYVKRRRESLDYE